MFGKCDVCGKWHLSKKKHYRKCRIVRQMVRKMLRKAGVVQLAEAIDSKSI